MGNNDNLENLLRSGGLKAEPPDRKECEGLLRSAIDCLQDAHNTALSFVSRYCGLPLIVPVGIKAHEIYLVLLRAISPLFSASGF